MNTHSHSVRKLQLFFILNLIAMLMVTTWASLDKNVVDGFVDVLSTRWGVATLFDTYFAFFTAYLWIGYKQSTWMNRFFWFILVSALGTIAIATFILVEVARALPADAHFSRRLLLARRDLKQEKA